MATQGPLSPATGITETGAGDAGWTNENNITSSNDQYATSTLQMGEQTIYLKANQFGFTLPAGATITRVEVEVEAKADAADAVVDIEVRLSPNDSIQGNNRAAVQALPTSDTYRSYDFTSQEWGLEELLTPEVVNADEFGCALRYRNDDLEPRTVSIDHLRITVEYVLPSGAKDRLLLGVG